MTRKNQSESYSGFHKTKRATVSIPNGDGKVERWKAAAKARNMTLTAFIIAAVEGLVGCAAPVEHDPQAWCISGATTEQVELARSAAEEWNATVDTALSVTPGTCEMQITVGADIGNMGEYDGAIRIAPLSSGVAKVDRAQFRWVVLHELGHSLGLGHSSDEHDVMNGVGAIQDRLTDGDVEAFAHRSL